MSELNFLIFVCVILLMLLLGGCSENINHKPEKNEPVVFTETQKTEETATAAENIWTKLSDMSAPRCSPGMASIDGKIYAVGGWDLQNGLNILGSVEEYNPESDTWTNKADMPKKRYNFGIAALDGYLYTICGTVKNTDPAAVNLFTGSNTVERYDPETDQWTKVKSTNGSPLYAGAVAAGDKIYVLYVSGGSMAVEEYNPETDLWVMKSGKTDARYGFAAVMLNNMIYLIGGTSADGYQAIKTVDQYDPMTDTWISKPDLTNARAEHTAAAAGNKIYIIGGWSDVGDSSFLFDEYDPVTGACISITAPLTDKMTFQSSVGFNNFVYMIGGINSITDRSFLAYSTGR